MIQKEQIAVKWIMRNSKLFTGEKDGYIIHISLGSYYPVWSIIKNGTIIDEAVYHHPVTTSFNKELAAKVQAERALNKIIYTINT